MSRSAAAIVAPSHVSLGTRARRVRRVRRAMARASGHQQSFHAVASPEGDVKLEVLSRMADGTSSKPPLVFVHGSYHAAWCWSEHFFQYFAARGHDCYALSMRGQGGSDMPPVADAKIAKIAGTLERHADDVNHFCASLGRRPVLVGHSFGGLVAQLACARAADSPPAGLALLASVPPTGNGEMVKRFLFRAPIASAKITFAFVTGAFKSNAALCRECFFSEDVSETTLARHMSQIASSSRVRLLDLSALNASLPVPAPPAETSVFVCGGEDDFVVDEEGLEETAAWGRTEAVILERTAHDLMLDTRWEAAAAALGEWVDRRVSPSY